ncbi:hypothetical protein CJ255_20815 [Candidatus Viridilinea mediisalina]|uniref:Uncharacterized protein n=1 Tax=Candidatus Viridilinea mediisalina TaxID=2024553 RepID=A0A2A6RDG1_9CHLR|nr:hypothetical protein [Candidatus Viridilinea mediisalina]PDW00304.1 hypothetical protein CJ255_20815 [Candidatus Viridilinea mediisalina]
MTLTSHSALSVGAGGSSGTLADKSIVRDGWGRPLIPGSQLKGSCAGPPRRASPTSPPLTKSRPIKPT